MNLELDFLIELIRQPGMKSTSSYIARRLGWDRGRARVVAKALEERGVVKVTQSGYRHTGPYHVRLAQPESC